MWRPANGCRRRSAVIGRRVCWPRRTRWPSIRWGSISSAPNGTISRGGRASTTICTRRPWRTIRPQARFTTRTMPAPRGNWPVSVFTNIGTMRKRRNTLATSGEPEGLNSWPWRRSIMPVDCPRYHAPQNDSYALAKSKRFSVERPGHVVHFPSITLHLLALLRAGSPVRHPTTGRLPHGVPPEA